MPRNLSEDHAAFRAIVQGVMREDLRKQIASCKLFRSGGQSVKIAVPIAEMAPLKKKRFRSIDDPWEES